MRPEFQYGDILIKRISNGWIAISGSELSEPGDEITVTSVYEDPERGEHAGSESLLYLIQEQFDGYTQSKKQGGIKLEIREKGYAFEEDDEFREND
jgi:hypothetical protein